MRGSVDFERLENDVSFKSSLMHASGIDPCKGHVSLPSSGSVVQDTRTDQRIDSKLNTLQKVYQQKKAINSDHSADKDNALFLDVSSELVEASYKFSESGAFLVDEFEIGVNGVRLVDEIDPSRHKLNQRRAAKKDAKKIDCSKNVDCVKKAKYQRCSQSSLRQFLREDLVTMSVLGHGASSTVFKAIHAPTLTVVAQKVIPIFDDQKRRQMVRELRALYGTTSQSQYVVDFYDAFVNPIEGTVSVLMEYMDGGSLQDCVDRGDCTHETVLANVAWRVLMGLDYLHAKRRRIHRDIKPANLMVNSHGEIKIGDFGIAREFYNVTTKEHTSEQAQYKKHNRRDHSSIEDDESIKNYNDIQRSISSLPKKSCNSSIRQNSFANSFRNQHNPEMLMSFVGTVRYMSPERLLGERYDTKADVWGLGVTLLTCALGRFPFAHADGFWGLLQALKDGIHPELPPRFSHNAKSFVNACLIRDPAKRPDAGSLLHHPFVNECSHKVNNAASTSNWSDIVQRELDEIIQALQVHYRTKFSCLHKYHKEKFQDIDRLTNLANQLGAPLSDVRTKFTKMMTALEHELANRDCSCNL